MRRETLRGIDIFNLLISIRMMRDKKKSSGQRSVLHHSRHSIFHSTMRLFHLRNEEETLLMMDIGLDRNSLLVISAFSYQVDSFCLFFFLFASLRLLCLLVSFFPSSSSGTGYSCGREEQTRLKRKRKIRTTAYWCMSVCVFSNADKHTSFSLFFFFLSPFFCFSLPQHWLFASTVAAAAAADVVVVASSNHHFPFSRPSSFWALRSIEQ